MFISISENQISGVVRFGYPGENGLCMCACADGEYLKAKGVNFSGSIQFFGGFVGISLRLQNLRCGSLLKT